MTKNKNVVMKKCGIQKYCGQDKNIEKQKLKKKNFEKQKCIQSMPQGKKYTEQNCYNQTFFCPGQTHF